MSREFRNPKIPCCSDPEPKFPPLTDFQITKCMLDIGGSFVKALANAFRLADDENKAKLKSQFKGYWDKYEALTVRCPECGKTDILKRHHPGNQAIPECCFNECEHCLKQWGHQ